MLKEKTCINCNSEFIPSRRDLKYCSPECRSSYYYYSRKTNKTTQNNSPSNYNIEDKLLSISNPDNPEASPTIPIDLNLNIASDLCLKLSEVSSYGLEGEDKILYERIFYKQSMELCNTINLDGVISNIISKYTSQEVSIENAILGFGASMVFLSLSIRNGLKQQKKEV